MKEPFWLTMAKKRHHHIPQFLLKRFASRRDGDKAWVYQFDTTGPTEISIKDAAVSKYFYGHDSTEIEDKIQTFEDLCASTLADIDRNRDLGKHTEKLRKLVWIMAIRTRALRETFSDVGTRLLEDVGHERYGDEARSALRHRFETSFDEDLNHVLERLPPPFGAKVKAHLADPRMAEIIKKYAKSQIPDLDVPSFLQQVLGTIDLETRMGAAARTGHLSGLKGIVSAGVWNVPENFQPGAWELIPALKDTIILGDACVVATSKAGDAGSLLRFSETWNAVYLPISSSLILCGKRDNDVKIWSAVDINLASARTASSYFYAAQNSEVVRGLGKMIGTEEALLTDEDIETLTRTAWENASEDTSDS